MRSNQERETSGGVRLVGVLVVLAFLTPMLVPIFGTWYALAGDSYYDKINATKVTASDTPGFVGDASGLTGITSTSLPKASTTQFGVVRTSVDATTPTAVEVSDTRLPTQDQKDAMVGTSGTPSGTNKYVTNADARNSNSRPPNTHKATHDQGQPDALSLGSPVAITGTAPGPGTATGYVRADHQHGHSQYASGDLHMDYLLASGARDMTGRLNLSGSASIPLYFIPSSGSTPTGLMLNMGSPSTGNYYTLRTNAELANVNDLHIDTTKGLSFELDGNSSYFRWRMSDTGAGTRTWTELMSLDQFGNLRLSTISGLSGDLIVASNLAPQDDTYSLGGSGARFRDLHLSQGLFADTATVTSTFKLPNTAGDPTGTGSLKVNSTDGKLKVVTGNGVRTAAVLEETNTFTGAMLADSFSATTSISVAGENVARRNGNQTTNAIPKWTSATTLGNSSLQDNAATITATAQLFVSTSNNGLRVSAGPGSAGYASATTSIFAGEGTPAKHAINISSGGWKSANVFVANTGITAPPTPTTGFVLGSVYGASAYQSASLHLDCQTGSGLIKLLTGGGTVAPTERMRIDGSASSIKLTPAGPATASPLYNFLSDGTYSTLLHLYSGTGSGEINRRSGLHLDTSGSTVAGNTEVSYLQMSTPIYKDGAANEGLEIGMNDATGNAYFSRTQGSADGNLKGFYLDTGGGLRVSGNILPATDTTGSVGNVSSRFASGYFQSLTVPDYLYIPATAGDPGAVEGALKVNATDRHLKWYAGGVVRAAAMATDTRVTRKTISPAAITYGSAFTQTNTAKGLGAIVGRFDKAATDTTNYVQMTFRIPGTNVSGSFSGTAIAKNLDTIVAPKLVMGFAMPTAVPASNNFRGFRVRFKHLWRQKDEDPFVTTPDQDQAYNSLMETAGTAGTLFRAISVDLSTNLSSADVMVQVRISRETENVADNLSIDGGVTFSDLDLMYVYLEYQTQYEAGP